MEKLYNGIFQEKGEFLTKNLNPGDKVYGEKLLNREGEEYRFWDPHRSKAAAALQKGVEIKLDQDDIMLYLGAASGTTVSHFSDVLDHGLIYAVEYSKPVARKLVNLAEKRDNIAPIVSDARKTENYEDLIDSVDVIYQDISQRDQAEILSKNAEKFLTDEGEAFICVKARSISSSREVEQIFQETKGKLQNDFQIEEETRLEPFEKDHLFIHLKKK